LSLVALVDEQSVADPTWAPRPTPKLAGTMRRGVVRRPRLLFSVAARSGGTPRPCRRSAHSRA
jgi:hypothetical protein